MQDAERAEKAGFWECWMLRALRKPDFGNTRRWERRESWIMGTPDDASAEKAEFWERRMLVAPRKPDFETAGCW